MPDRLLDDEALESSAVVANSAMNRERQLAGVNSYTRELGFNPLDWVTARIGQSPQTMIGWLDLCCGTGRCLLQAADTLARDGLDHLVTIVGVDLVDFFDPTPVQGAALQLTCASITSWSPPRRFDLITCVHGLHYLGDKLVRCPLTFTGCSVAVVDPRLLGERLPTGWWGGPPRAN
jgi:SAM-dependent methyltransferase